MRSSGRLSVRDDAGQLLAALEFDNQDWQRRILSFSVKEPGNCRLGIERGNATEGWARIDDAVLDSI